MSNHASNPDYAVPTGEFISEWLDENAMSQAELARRLGVSRKHVSKLIDGSAPLSHEVGHDLALVTGIAARIWMNQEALYREDLERIRAESSLAIQFESILKFPVAYLRQRGHISALKTDHAGVTRDVLRFFGVADLHAWEATWKSPQAAYKKAASTTTDNYALATWLRLGELQVANQPLPAYSVDRLFEVLPALRALTLTPADSYGDAVRSMVELSASAGVAVVFEPEIPGTKCYGATRWLNGETPLVQLSLRGKKDDALWFAFFHEIGHIVKHPKNAIFIESKGSDDSVLEEEANSFAADTLIPPDAISRLPRGKNLQAVRDFANEVGVSPGIVIGRIHKETGNYSWGHSLKLTLKFDS